MKVIEWKARKLEKEDDEKCEHKQRMKQDHGFYSWMIARVRERLHAMNVLDDGIDEYQEFDGGHLNIHAPVG